MNYLLEKNRIKSAETILLEQWITNSQSMNEAIVDYLEQTPFCCFDELGNYLKTIISEHLKLSINPNDNLACQLLLCSMERCDFDAIALQIMKTLETI